MRWPVFALALTCAACGSGSAGSAGVGATHPPTTASPTSQVRAVTTVQSGDGPVGLAVDPTGAVWVADAGSSQVSRVRGGHKDLDVGGVDTPLRLLASDGAVWATAFGSGELVRITPAGEVSGRVAVGKGAEGVAAGFGSVWVVAQDAGRLVRVDPRRLKVESRVDIGIGARLVTTGPGAVWVSQFRDGRVLRVNPATRSVTASAVLCQGPQGLVATAHVVWVTCTKDNVLLRLDPRTLKTTLRVPMPEAPDGIAAGPANTLYVVSQAGPTLVTVDATTGAVRAKQVLGAQAQLYDQANLDVAAAADEVWVSSFAENLIRRVDPIDPP
jgi:streptogramin lyase